MYHNIYRCRPFLAAIPTLVGLALMSFAAEAQTLAYRYGESCAALNAASDWDRYVYTCVELGSEGRDGAALCKRGYSACGYMCWNRSKYISSPTGFKRQECKYALADGNCYHYNGNGAAALCTHSLSTFYCYDEATEDCVDGQVGEEGFEPEEEIVDLPDNNEEPGGDESGDSPGGMSASEIACARINADAWCGGDCYNSETHVCTNRRHICPVDEPEHRCGRCYASDSKDLGEQCHVEEECVDSKCSNGICGTAGHCVCRQDSDCDNDEFCWTGVAGIGTNDCRSLKSQGSACSRHGQCQSDCCRLHISKPWTKQCRPANRCQ